MGIFLTSTLASASLLNCKGDDTDANYTVETSNSANQFTLLIEGLGSDKNQILNLKSDPDSKTKIWNFGEDLVHKGFTRTNSTLTWKQGSSKAKISYFVHDFDSQMHERVSETLICVL